MNFDQLGRQHVSKRRKPSPLRKKRSGASFDAHFSQQVWPRSRHTADDDDMEGEQHRSSGFKIPASWVKNIVIAAGILVIGLVGTNWDSIAKKFKLSEVSAVTLTDNNAYDIMIGGYKPLIPWETVPPDAETARTAYSPGEMPLNLTETFTWSEYEIKKGDTISGIASKFSLSPGSIISFNGIQEAWNIRDGKKLKIPNMDGISYTVEKSDSISKIAAKMKVPQNAILDANNILSDTILPGEILFIPGAQMNANEFSRAYKKREKGVDKPLIYPLNGRITSGYGWREDPVRPIPGKGGYHKAIDIAGKIGDPVKAAMGGTVARTDNNSILGNFIILKHGEYQTVYAHLSAYSVKTGETVKQGQEIGKVGNTGYTTGPHLHFEAYHNGNRINPLDLLK